MKELISIHDHNGKSVVSARELHEFLEVKTRFRDWIERMFEYGFEENTDYVRALNFERGGNEAKEYALTLDCAKEISMVQRNEKGKQARKYFIEVERKYKEDQKKMISTPNFNNPAEAARAWADQYEVAQQASQKAFIEEQARVKAEKIVEEQAPKVAFTNAVSASSGSCLIGELAKLLAQNGYKIGEKRLFAWMRENGYLGSQGERHNVPNQRYIEQKLFEIKRGVRTGSGGEMKTTLTPKVTGKGQVYFIEKLITSKQMVLKEACNLPTN
jgi:anti-repressor protein